MAHRQTNDPAPASPITPAQADLNEASVKAGDPRPYEEHAPVPRTVVKHAPDAKPLPDRAPPHRPGSSPSKPKA